MAQKSDTHLEPLYEGYKVRIQHCEYKDPETGEVCNKYLGVEYPSEVCGDHR